MKSTFILSLLALSARVLASPPACLLAAVNTEPHPADLDTVCGSDATKVQAEIQKLCSGSNISVAQSAFIDTCSSAGKTVAPYTASATKSGTHSATQSASVTGSSGSTASETAAASTTATGTSTGTFVYTTEVYETSCSCTQTLTISVTGASVSNTGLTTSISAASTTSTSTSVTDSTATAAGTTATGSGSSPNVTGAAVAGTHNVGSFAAAAIAIAGVVAVL